MKVFPRVAKSDRSDDVKLKLALMPLEPIGRGTGEVESLSSYLTRLACDHWNTPTHLYKAILEWHSGEKATAVKSDSRIDSFTLTTSRFVEALNTCSPLEFDFAGLTCLSWREVLSSRVRGPLNRELRWCVDCYRQMSDVCTPLHQRLLWSIAPATVCPSHKSRLHNSCPNCGSTQRFLMADCVVGYCQHCGRDVFSSAAKIEYERDPNSEALWKSKACEDLIRVTRGDNYLEEEQLRQATYRLVNSEFEGSVRRMCKELNVSPDAYRSFLFRGQRTNLPLLIDFAYRIDVMPSELFSQNCMLRINRRRIAPTRQFRTYKALSDDRRQEIRLCLRRIIDSAEELSSTTEIAAMVGINRRLLTTRFPDENAEIVRKVRARLARQKCERDEQRARRVRSRAEELMAQNIYPSDRQVLNDKRILPSDLRLPQIKIVLREIQRDFLAAKPVKYDDSALRNRSRGSQKRTPATAEIQRTTGATRP